MSLKPHWQLPTPRHVPAELAQYVNDRLVAQLLVQQNLTTVQAASQFLNPTAYQPTTPFALPDMERAVQRLHQAIQQGEKICVWGDFDVDGQTSTTLLVSVLRQLGGEVCYYIPNRMTESHGIKLPALERLIAQHKIDLLLTCDTGVAEHAAVEAAHAAGLTVIITDHHDLPPTLPPAEAVVNPKRLSETHPLRELPGVGIAYKLAEGLLDDAPHLEAQLDLVALGIVADVAVQTGDTRYLLQRGLPILSQTKRLGLQAIIQQANLTVERLTEEHIGFWIGPRLNALGRLGDANLAVELLTTTNTSRAQILATQLEGMNEQRKLLVEHVVNEATAQIEQTPSLAEYHGLVLAGQQWHPGVVGIAASRLGERYDKPTILISLQPDGTGRGSARSVPGCDIHQAIKSQAALLDHFGGHPMAAGLSMAAANLIPFRRGVSAALADCQAQRQPTVRIDALVTLKEVDYNLLTRIERLAPFGNGNPPIQLAAQRVQVVSETLFGKTNAHRRVTVVDEQQHQREVIWWSGATETVPHGWFDLAFTISADDFRGENAVQMEWLTARSLEPETVTIKPQFVDWRREPHPVAAVQAQKLTMVWGEGRREAELTLRHRQQLQPAPALVIWTTPPSETVFAAAMATVAPRQVYVVGRPSPFDAPRPFITQLMGLVKYALNQKGGHVTLSQLAAMLGHQTETVRLGLALLAAQGKLAYQQQPEAEGTVQLQAAQQPANRAELRSVQSRLQNALAETAAYRRFFGASISQR